jgi:hypothetical protein
MTNAMGLLLLGFLIASVIGLVIIVEIVATKSPDTRIGRLCKQINDFIEKLPDD